MEIGPFVEENSEKRGKILITKQGEKGGEFTPPTPPARHDQGDSRTRERSLKHLLAR